jgi:hypothetical protein
MFRGGVATLRTEYTTLASCGKQLCVRDLGSRKLLKNFLQLSRDYIMSNATPSRLGAINGGSDKDALFLKVFAGEVLTAFAEKNVMMDKHMVRTISNGKSA